MADDAIAILKEAARSRVEEVCRTLAPQDLAGLPLYVIFASDLPAECGGRHLRGFSWCYMHVAAAQYLPHLWRGPGPAIYINDQEAFKVIVEGHAEDHPGEYFAVKRWHLPFFLRGVVGIMIHEIGHVFEIGSPFYLENKDVSSSTVTTRIAERSNQKIDLIDGPAAPVPFNRHGWRFIRNAAHLTFRASQRGFRIDPTTVVNHDRYQLSPLSQWMELLADELQEMEGATFGEIDQRRPPDAFRETWLARMRDFVLRFDHSDKAKVAAIVAARSDIWIESPLWEPAS